MRPKTCKTVSELHLEDHKQIVPRKSTNIRLYLGNDLLMKKIVQTIVGSPDPNPYTHKEAKEHCYGPNIITKCVPWSYMSMILADVLCTLAPLSSLAFLEAWLAQKNPMRVC